MKVFLSGLILMAGASLSQAAPFLAHAPLTYQGAVTATVPWGSTIQCTQAGTEIGSITYTPSWGTNKLIVSVQVQGQYTAIGTLQLSLCQDGVTTTLGRLVETVPTAPTPFAKPLIATWIINATNTQARTYRVKLGSDTGTAYTVYENAFPGFLSVQEVQILP